MHVPQNMRLLLTSVLFLVLISCVAQNAPRTGDLLTVTYHGDNPYPTLSTTYDPLFAPAAPVITTDPANLEVCSGQQTTLTATSEDEIYWYTSPPPAGKPVGKGKIFVTPALEEGYYVYYAIAHNQKSFSNFTSIDIVMVYPLPVLNVVSSHPALCAGETATLSARGAKDLTWSTGEKGSSISIAPEVNTLYTVSGINTAGCRASESIQQVVDDCKLYGEKELTTTDLPVFSLHSAEVKIYPNPNQGEFHVACSSTSDSRIYVVNALGELVYDAVVESEVSTVDISRLPNGVYFVSVSVNNVMASQDKIVKN